MYVLVLYWHSDTEETLRPAIRQHLHALDLSNSHFHIIYYNAVGGAPAWLRHFHFDAVILHTTFLALRWSSYFRDGWKKQLGWLRDVPCIKIAIPQDEYDHSEILDEWLEEWGVSAIFTNFGINHRAILYPRLHAKARFFKCHTGYIDPILAERYAPKLLSIRDRSVDIVYRASHLPYWVGSHGQLKHQIGSVVMQHAAELGLRCDISTRPDEVIIGEPWFDFLASGRAVLGCESGSSVLDRRGEIQAKIDALVTEKPDLSFDEASSQMPSGWDDHRFFALSPRHFEAVITKTCQVLVEGEYEGVFRPNIHYIPLKRDFSNVEEVLKKVKDHSYLQQIVDRAYYDIYQSGDYTYRGLARDLGSLIGERRQVNLVFTVLRSILWPFRHLVRDSERQRLGDFRAAFYSPEPINWNRFDKPRLRRVLVLHQ
jgi:hypothetical protein